MSMFIQHHHNGATDAFQMPGTAWLDERSIPGTFNWPRNEANGNDSVLAHHHVGPIDSVEMHDLTESFEQLPPAPTTDIVDGVGQLALGRFELARSGAVTWNRPLLSCGYHALTSLSVELDPDAGGQWVNWRAMSATVATGDALATLIRRTRAWIPIGRRPSETIDVYQVRLPLGEGGPASWPPIRGTYLAAILIRHALVPHRASGFALRRPLDMLAWDARLWPARMAPVLLDLVAAPGNCDMLILAFHSS